MTAVPVVDPPTNLPSLPNERSNEPLRGDLCGPAHLEEIARTLATTATKAGRARGHPLLVRLKENRRVLLDAHERIARDIREQAPLTPDAEWLLDNFYVIEEVMRGVRKDLPRGFYQKLPASVAGPLPGRPRVYELAVFLVACSDGLVDEPRLVEFVNVYQKTCPLYIGEIWALPTMLRLVLLENLRRLSAQMVQARSERSEGEGWAKQSLIEFHPPDHPSDAFLAAVQPALRDQAALPPALHDWLNRNSHELADALRREHRRQAANQVSVGNCVTSLRLLKALDWSAFFEKVSRLDAVLRRDPAGVYARQDFGTRDRYRREVEMLARGSRHDEFEVARRVLAAAGAADEPVRQHVGWYLVGDGRRDFEKELGYRARLSQWRKRVLTGHPSAVYFGLIAGTTLLVALAAAWLVAGVSSFWMVLGIAALALLPAADVAVAVTNFLVCRLVSPRVLPKLDFKEGIASDCPTFVVIPGMLTSPQGVANLLERLEMHYLANPDPQLWFALLTDFADAPAEQAPNDNDLVNAALAGIRRLNERHGSGDVVDRFYLLHRRRQWNPSEGCWMGWERKRGKLHEFNQLLRGDTGTSYNVQSGDVSRLPRIRFVLTLDADTVLPREAARQLVGTLAHPLNQPRLSPDGRRVVSGYSVLQPRVSFLYRTNWSSWFARLFAGSAGVDPYSAAVSDAYQDLFGRASFTGKGLYDLDAFAATAGEAFPDNHILSHDLIESNFARCALVSDVEVFDDFPSRYHAYARREHRWARGDWQLLPWLGRRVPTPRGMEPNVLPPLERWKVIDNLRRSLVPLSLVLLLVLGWTVLPGSPAGWSLFVLLVLAVPLPLFLVGSFLDVLRGGKRREVLRTVETASDATAGQILLSATFLPHQALTLADATVRTLVRLFVTRRHLLEWETAAATDVRLGGDLRSFVRATWPASALAAVLAAVVAGFAPQALPAAAPWLLAWALCPVVAWLVSQPRPLPVPKPGPAETQAFRRVARRTWHFFETFVGPDDHWLPPDNYQEEPKGEVAHRTSPTNCGLLLLSTLAAHDLGYLSLSALIRRIGSTFNTFDRLHRHRGHFFNWYDTQTLAPLLPAYVSTVDSGNLLACLWTLKGGLREKLGEPVPSPAALDGLRDTLAQLNEEIHQIERPFGSPGSPWTEVGNRVSGLASLLAGSPADLLDWAGRLAAVEEAAVQLDQHLERLADLLAATPEGAVRWSRALVEQVRSLREDLRSVAPWVEVLREGGDWPGGGELREELVRPAGLKQLAGRTHDLAERVRRANVPAEWQDRLLAALHRSVAAEWTDAVNHLTRRAERFAAEMDFRFLYDNTRNLFSIGYNLTLNRRDQAHYDLLASEAALTSFLCVARNDVPRKHWFQLGRPMLETAGHIGLISWGGTMFEYLMPRLLLPIAQGTLLDSAQRTAVRRQIEYGQELGLPWGVSESGFYFLNAYQDYQYQSFGVPGLGLKRDLGRDRVVAPYASLLAAGITPRAVLHNLRSLRGEGGEGPFGFYEAIDFTHSHVPPSGLPAGRSGLVVRSYMAHHQGMGLLALANLLTGDRMPKRLRSDPRVRAAELLLDERLPVDAPLLYVEEEDENERPLPQAGSPVNRRITSPDTPGPRTNVLSNGRFTTVVTNAGGGFSTCNGMDVTRWRSDRTQDGWGSFIYVRDLESGKYWSAGHQPTCVPADAYEVVFSVDKAQFRRIDHDVETVLEVCVTSERDLEVRRVTLRNLDAVPRELELTSYVELALYPHSGDLAHPAFGKLFLETEWLPESHALLCRRRPREADQKPLWAVHVVMAESHLGGMDQLEPSAGADGTAEPVGETSLTTFETSRERFLGRRRTPANPAAMDPGSRLSGAAGPVLDPIFSLRRVVRLEPGGRAEVAFATGIAGSREEARALADHHHTLQAAGRAFELAWAHSRVELRDMGLSPEDAQLMQRLAGHVLYPGPALRARPEVLVRSHLNQVALWRHGISGDLPVLVLRLSDARELPLLRQMVAGHAYWRGLGLRIDMVVLNEDAGGYFEELQHQIMDLLRTREARDCIDCPGGVFPRKVTHLSREDLDLILSVARAVLVGERGLLANQIDVVETLAGLPPRLLRRDAAPEAEAFPPGELVFFNGHGGFTPDGREYVLPAGTDAPPAPWVNVVANPKAGFLVTDSGAGFTWAGNSQANRLTPWSNDPVSDPVGETVYLRDQETGAVWSPTPLPVRDGAATEVRHGQGYTTFVQVRDGLRQELCVFVPVSEPVKVWLLRVRNTGRRARKLSATFYAEWVLGTNREQTGPHVVTWEDGEDGPLLARNHFSADFGSAVAFADVSLRPRTLTGDRMEFLGRNRSPARPRALERVRLSGRTGGGLDPCAALQGGFDLEPGQETAMVFVLGQGATAGEAKALAARFRQVKQAEEALRAVTERWDHLLGALTVKTPDEALNLVVNRWLLYQTLSCRVWGRSGFYQSGGAYGFRDQLQDVMAAVLAAPEETRAHLLRAASRQFPEGDVQHWWHPPGGQGVRTHFSDDFLWLPFVTGYYVETAGDEGVLDEKVPFLSGPAVPPGVEDAFFRPERSGEQATLYEHCLRALDNGWKLGPHGLPLMGSGDWNDGMNKVGAEGRGESVWVAWFQICCLRRFAELADRRGDLQHVLSFRQRTARLVEALEKSGWDGEWYRRAYFDDGTPLGSRENDECQIDSLPQSWAVIAGEGEPDRARRGMQSALDRLVRREERLVLLFDPPFDKGRLQPGYIKGYVPGIRENGGQYTHAAIWVVQALARLGRGKEAYQLFDLINPVRHAETAEQVETYRVEPYVVAADVYGMPPHVGRGGWTWYTGSASWLYRVAVEELLGFRRRGDELRVDPRIPGEWERFEIHYRHGKTTYHVRVENPKRAERGVARVTVDGVEQRKPAVRLVDDEGTHEVVVEMG